MKAVYAALAVLACNLAFTSDIRIQLLPKDDLIPELVQKVFDADRILHPKTQIEVNNEIPDVVDLRWRDTEVRSESEPKGATSGLIAAMENKLEGKVKLSEDYLWSLTHEIQPAAVVNAASSSPIAFADREGASYYLKSAHYIEDKIRLAVKALANGNPVFLSFVITQDVVHCKTRPNKDSQPLNAAHAVAVVGYDQIERTFLVKNSWGKNCGDAGYQHIPFEYCTRPGMYCLMWSIDEVGE